MAYHLDIDLDSGFEPQQRARSNTWPLPRPENYVESGDVESLCAGGGGGGGVGCGAGGRIATEEPPRGCDLDRGASVDSIGAQLDAGLGPIALAAAAKKNSSRRNAWGNMSYAELITQAIQSSPDKRLTLSQIYDWMVQNVPYFKDKGDSNSSAGWKVSLSIVSHVPGPIGRSPVTSLAHLNRRTIPNVGLR